MSRAEISCQGFCIDLMRARGHPAEGDQTPKMILRTLSSAGLEPLLDEDGRIVGLEPSDLTADWQDHLASVAPWVSDGGIVVARDGSSEIRFRFTRGLASIRAHSQRKQTDTGYTGR